MTALPRWPEPAWPQSVRLSENPSVRPAVCGALWGAEEALITLLQRGSPSIIDKRRPGNHGPPAVFPLDA